MAERKGRRAKPEPEMTVEQALALLKKEGYGVVNPHAFDKVDNQREEGVIVQEDSAVPSNKVSTKVTKKGVFVTLVLRAGHVINGISYGPGQVKNVPFELSKVLLDQDTRAVAADEAVLNSRGRYFMIKPVMLSNGNLSNAAIPLPENTSDIEMLKYEHGAAGSGGSYEPYLIRRT